MILKISFIIINVVIQYFKIPKINPMFTIETTFNQCSFLFISGVSKSGVGTPSGIGMVNIWGHKLVMGSLTYCHDIGQRGPTTGPRNNIAQVFDHKQRQPFF